MWPRTRTATLVSVATLVIGALVARLSGHWYYNEVLNSVETSVEIAILFFVVLEGISVVSQVREIRDSTATIVGSTDALQIGSRVHVLVPEPGKPREAWTHTGEVWAIRSVDKDKNRAVATPVFPAHNEQGRVPTVEGPMTGPLSPFIRLNIPA
jgi:hypothetical protein